MAVMIQGFYGGKWKRCGSGCFDFLKASELLWEIGEFLHKGSNTLHKFLCTQIYESSKDLVTPA